MKRVLLLAAAGAITVLAATIIAPALAGDGPVPREVQEVRAAVARYHSFGQAERDGYTVEGEPCVASPAGTMGIHAVNPALLADSAIDALRPRVTDRAGKPLAVDVYVRRYWCDAIRGCALTVPSCRHVTARFVLPPGARTFRHGGLGIRLP